jgi:hypothetical protein
MGGSGVQRDLEWRATSARRGARLVIWSGEAGNGWLAAESKTDAMVGDDWKEGRRNWIGQTTSGGRAGLSIRSFVVCRRHAQGLRPVAARRRLAFRWGPGSPLLDVARAPPTPWALCWVATAGRPRLPRRPRLLLSGMRFDTMRCAAHPARFRRGSQTGSQAARQRKTAAAAPAR